MKKRKKGLSAEKTKHLNKNNKDMLEMILTVYKMHFLHDMEIVQYKNWCSKRAILKFGKAEPFKKTLVRRNHFEAPTFAQNIRP